MNSMRFPFLKNCSACPRCPSSACRGGSRGRWARRGSSPVCVCVGLAWSRVLGSFPLSSWSAFSPFGCFCFVRPAGWLAGPSARRVVVSSWCRPAVASGGFAPLRPSAPPCSSCSSSPCWPRPRLGSPRRSLPCHPSIAPALLLALEGWSPPGLGLGERAHLAARCCPPAPCPVVPSCVFWLIDRSCSIDLVRSIVFGRSLAGSRVDQSVGAGQRPLRVQPSAWCASLHSFRD
jgi:hypothetical protein